MLLEIDVVLLVSLLAASFSLGVLVGHSVMARAVRRALRRKSEPPPPPG